MSKQEIYGKFIQWLGKTWWELPESDRLMPMITVRYTRYTKEGVRLWRK